MKQTQPSKSNFFMQDYQLANIEWQNDRAFSRDSFDYYASMNGRKGEFEHVFNHGNNLTEKFQQLSPSKPPNQTPYDFAIGEIGFGLGLNFLLTSELFLQHANKQCTLAYFSAEWKMPAIIDIQKAWQNIGIANPQATALLSALNRPWRAGWNEFKWQFDKRNIALFLWIGSIDEMCEDIAMNQPENQIDAWYLDGFSLQTNPQAWQSTLVRKLIACSHAGTSYATFSSHPDLLKNLASNHAQPVKLPGYQNKRKFIAGNFSNIGPPKTVPTPINSQTIKIIGSGITGAITARKLAELGHRVSIIGLPQTQHLPTGIIHPQLSTADTALSKQRWDAWLLTCEWLRHHPLQWLDRSVMQIFNTPKAMRKMQRLLDIPFMSMHLCSMPLPSSPLQHHKEYTEGFTAMDIKHCGSGSIAHYITTLLDHPNITKLVGDYHQFMDLDCAHTIITTASILTASARKKLGITLQKKACAKFTVNKTLATAMVGQNWLSSSTNSNQQPAVWIGTEDGNLNHETIEQLLAAKSRKLIAQYNTLMQDDLQISNFSATEIFTGIKTSNRSSKPVCLKISNKNQDLLPTDLEPRNNSSYYLNIAMGSRGIINACWAAHQTSNLLVQNKIDS